MNLTYLNLIPQMVETGHLSTKQAIQKMALFVQQNISVFNIIECDEDLRSEIVLHILDKGEILFNKYSKECGDFFNYFYSFVKNTEISCRRRQQKSTLQDIHNVNEKILEFNENCDVYSPSRYSEPEQRKVPYRAERINIQAFQTACKNNKYAIKQFVDKEKDNELLKKKIAQMSPIKLRKTILILALKSAYYLTDYQINRIAVICHVEKFLLHQAIQTLKSQLYDRENSKLKMEERRNNAYFQHKRYMNQLNWLRQSNEESDQYKIEQLQTKYLAQTEKWLKLNSLLASGVRNIRPTNKAIAEILGICERQVSYYIKNARELERNN